MSTPALRRPTRRQGRHLAHVTTNQDRHSHQPGSLTATFRMIPIRPPTLAGVLQRARIRSDGRSVSDGERTASTGNAPPQLSVGRLVTFTGFTLQILTDMTHSPFLFPTAHTPCPGVRTPVASRQPCDVIPWRCIRPCVLAAHSRHRRPALIEPRKAQANESALSAQRPSCFPRPSPPPRGRLMSGRRRQYPVNVRSIAFYGDRYGGETDRRQRTRPDSHR